MSLREVIIGNQSLNAVDLSAYAWEARYPGTSEPVTEEEYQEALHHAKTVLSWAEKQIG